MTLEAPAASAMATSRGCRTPPSAQTCLPTSRASAAHSSTAENCGRPTPVIIRVVHMAPGPTPTLTMSAPASMRSRTPSADDDVAGHDRHLRVEGADRLRAPRASSPGGRARCRRRGCRRRRRAALGLARDVAVDADGGGDAQPAVASTAGRVERGAQRALAGEDAHQPAVGVDRGGERRLAASSRSKASRGSMSASSSSRSRVMTSGSWVKRSTPVQVGLGDDADRAAVRRRRRPAPCARLGSRTSASATVWCGASTMGCRGPGGGS